MKQVVLLIAAALAASTVGAQEPVRIKFTLDWVIDGQQTPFFLTHGKGYFTQQGLNVTDVQVTHPAHVAMGHKPMQCSPVGDDGPPLQQSPVL